MFPTTRYSLRRLLALAVLTLVLAAVVAAPLYAQMQFLRIYEFKKLPGLQLEILTKAAFQEAFSENLLIPRTDAAVLQLARQLYSKAGREQIREMCGEAIYGLLYAALTNPDIVDKTRDDVGDMVDADVPSLPLTYTSGHFKFYYTTSDAVADNNVTLAEIQATATVLNNAWNSYVADFKEPKSYSSGGTKMVDVKVYYLGATLYGVTDSHWSHIELNSKYVVKNADNRRTTPVHELFHRVQYSYGYVTGTANMKWATEGTASWSQKYLGSAVGDWMDRMSQGLNNSDRSLIVDRSYDACHFWIYLGQQAGGEKKFIKQVWQNYLTNGKKMKEAVDAATKALIVNNPDFNSAVLWWSFANLRKDFTNTLASFDYQEDESVVSAHGPLAHAPRTTQALNVGTNATLNGTVAANGADYYVFNIGATVKKIEIKATAPSANFAFAHLEIKNNNCLYYERGSFNQSSYTYTKTVTPGQLSQVGFIVIGCPNGGNYSINYKGSL